jgi:hypothetical protein
MAVGLIAGIEADDQPQFSTALNVLLFKGLRPTRWWFPIFAAFVIVGAAKRGQPDRRARRARDRSGRTPPVR